MTNHQSCDLHPIGLRELTELVGGAGPDDLPPGVIPLPRSWPLFPTEPKPERPFNVGEP